MSSIIKVGPKKYRARWRTPDGESRSRTFERRVDAERHLTSVEGDKLRGTYVDPSAGRIRRRFLGDVVDEAAVAALVTNVDHELVHPSRTAGARQTAAQQPPTG